MEFEAFFRDDFEQLERHFDLPRRETSRSTSG
jgi:hypothetical protein